MVEVPSQDVNGFNLDRVVLGFDAKDVRFDPDDSAPNYVGLHESQGAATSDSHWVVIKFTYSGSNVTRIQKAKGAWDDRASLF